MLQPMQLYYVAPIISTYYRAITSPSNNPLLLNYLDYNALRLDYYKSLAILKDLTSRLLLFLIKLLGYL
jgi:hypothetical protein